MVSVKDRQTASTCSAVIGPVSAFEVRCLFCFTSDVPVACKRQVEKVAGHLWGFSDDIQKHLKHFEILDAAYFCMWVPWNFMTTCVQVCPGKAMLWFLRLPCIQIQPSGKQPTNSNSLSRLSPNSELPPWDQPRHTTALENPRKGWNCLQFELKKGIRYTRHWDTQKDSRVGPAHQRLKIQQHENTDQNVSKHSSTYVLRWPSLQNLKKN